MGRTWVLVSIPPVMGLLVFVLVWRAGAVHEPTREEIERVPQRPQATGVSGEGSPRFNAERLREALRRAMEESEGTEEGTETASAPSKETSPPQNPAATTKEAGGKTAGGPYRDELIQQAAKARNHNRTAYIWGLWAGGIAMLLAYAAVIWYVMVKVKKQVRSWREVVPPRREPTKEEFEATRAEPQELTEELTGGETDEILEPPSGEEVSGWEEPQGESPKETEGTDEDRSGV